MKTRTRELAQATATAILGIDTLWGGDVMNPSGTGRFIADSWFSDEPLPKAYKHPAAARLRSSGGVAGQADRRSGGRCVPAGGEHSRCHRRIERCGRRHRRLAWCVPAGPERVPRRHVGPGAGKTRPRAGGAVRTMRDRPPRARPRPRPIPLRSVSASPSCWRSRATSPAPGRNCWPRSTPGGASAGCRRSPSRMLADACIAQFDAGAARHIVPYLPRTLRARAPGQHPVPRHRGRVVFRLDELPGPRPQP